MKWNVFLAPMKENAKPVRVLNYEPPQSVIETLAMNYGNIVIFSDKDLERFKQKV